MHKLLRTIPALSAALLCALLMPTAPAQAMPQAPSVPEGHVGNHCVGVVSQNNWHGTICSIVNENDARDDDWTQALITFSIRSGSISEVYIGGGLYIRRCARSGNCSNQNYRQSPTKRPGGGKQTFISNKFGYAFQYHVQARANTPCIIWTNGQVACHNGVLKSSWVQVGL